MMDVDVGADVDADEDADVGADVDEDGDDGCGDNADVDADADNDADVMMWVRLVLCGGYIVVSATCCSMLLVPNDSVLIVQSCSSNVLQHVVCALRVSPKCVYIDNKLARLQMCQDASVAVSKLQASSLVGAPQV